MLTRKGVRIAGIVLFLLFAGWINFAVKSNPPKLLQQFWGSSGRRASTVSNTMLKGKAAPAFSLQDLAGGKTSLSSLRGKVVVLDFRATWCGPCRMAMPLLQQFHERYAKRGVVVLGVNQREPRETAQDFIRKNHYTYRQLLDPDGTTGDSYGVTGIPMLVVIDQQGTVAAIHVGYDPRLPEVLAAEVGPVLRDAEKPPSNGAQAVEPGR